MPGKTLHTALFVFAALVFSVLLARPLHAQPDGGGRSQRAQEMLDLMKERLSLSDDQSAKVKEIIERWQEELRADREALRGDREAMMESMRTRSAAMYDSIAVHLTEAQKEPFEKVKEEIREKSRERFRERRGDR